MEALEADGRGGAERPELDRLREENEELREELDILVKARRFLAAEAEGAGG